MVSPLSHSWIKVSTQLCWFKRTNHWHEVGPVHRQLCFWWPHQPWVMSWSGMNKGFKRHRVAHLQVVVSALVKKYRHGYVEWCKECRITIRNVLFVHTDSDTFWKCSLDTDSSILWVLLSHLYFHFGLASTKQLCSATLRSCIIFFDAPRTKNKPANSFSQES